MNKTLARQFAEENLLYARTQRSKRKNPWWDRETFIVVLLVAAVACEIAWLFA